MNKTEVSLDWDRLTDILTVVRDGCDLHNLVNVESKRLPGVVKMIDPETRECVGLIFHSFSARFPSYIHLNEDHLKYLMDLSLDLTNESNVVNA